jgi:hypothetical protein
MCCVRIGDVSCLTPLFSRASILVKDPAAPDVTVVKAEFTEI